MPKTSVNASYNVGIVEAVAGLGLDNLPNSGARRISSFDEKFKKDCTKSFSVHAEMQLISHYKKGAARPPTLDYFGCSKKTCLLCEEFLASLSRPIRTRGRHGICYPAWGVPYSGSPAMEIAMKSLDKHLLSRIEFILNTKPRFRVPIPQSSLVSDFSELTLEEWERRDQNLEFFIDEERIRQSDFQIVSGLASQHTDRSIQLLEPENSCVMCNKIPSRRCSQCQSCYYCGPECQRSDFPHHKLLCRQFSNQSARPSTEHKRAIFFPVSRVKPRAIWVLCKRKTDPDDGISWSKVDHYPYLGTDAPLTGTLRIEHNPVRNRNLGSGFAAFAVQNAGYCVSLISRDAYLKDGSVENGSISMSVAASGPIAHSYRGPMLAVRELPRESYEDITLADFRHLIDYLVSYRSTNIRESPQNANLRAPRAVRGAKISCYGELMLHASDEFVSVDITRANLFALGNGTLSPISSKLGMPLLAWKDPGYEFMFDRAGWDEEMTPESNPRVAYLMTEIDPSKAGWGWAPLSWNSGIGNVFVLRKDGKDLDLHDVAMMCHFATHCLHRRFGDALEAGASSEAKNEVLDFITWENMVSHWRERTDSHDNYDYDYDYDDNDNDK